MTRTPTRPVPHRISQRRPARRLCCTATLLTLLTPALLAAAEVDWLHSQESCQALESSSGTVEVIPCGGLGLFYVWESGAPEITETASGCPTALSGRETPREVVPYPALATTGEWLPCDQGGCFGGAGPDRAAVVDWNHPHGWTVGATLLASSDAPLAADLYSLEESLKSLGPSQVPSVGDLHVLSALCRVAADADGAGPVPLVVNMSFGRIDGGETAGCSLASNSLPCQISRVLDHLHDDLGITLVAAAGNHGDLLFPAAHPAVLAAGSLNLEWFHHTGGTDAEAAWQSPAKPDVVFPGYALCLEEPQGTGVWRSPAGSSFASAVFAGWVAGARAQGLLSPPVTGLYSPRSDGYGGYEVTDGNGGAFAFEAGGKILGRSRSGSSSPCWQRPPEPVQQAVMALSVPVLPDPTELLPSLPQHSRDESRPTPEADPCVPCSGGGGHGSTALVGQLLTKALLVEQQNELAVDLSSAAALPAPQEVVAVYLRVANITYRLDTVSGDPLAGLTAGTLDTLVLQGVDAVSLPGDQISLLYELRWDKDPQHYWSSSPIHFPDEPAP